MKSKRNLIIKIIVSVLMLGLSLICFKYISDMNILPNKYLYFVLGGLLLLNIFGDILLFIKGKIWKVISIILYILICVISFFGINYSKSTTEFLNNSFNNAGEYTTYNVIVLKSSGYNKLIDLNNTTMGHLFIDIEENKYLDEITNKVSVTMQELDIFGIYDKLLNGEVSSIVINEAYLDMINEEYSDFDSKTKIIYSYNIKIEEKEEVKEVITELKPLSIYLSGSDSRGSISSKSRSDVNIILTINPNTHTILTTNIPRDYYVQLHNTTGLKDKLTHAGIYGVDKSRETLEDLFGIEIDYSIKVGFQSVVELVDLVGGIDVYSDTAFNSSFIPSWYVEKGINHMDGKKALAYSRERYAYKDGDRHRGRNQQQVMEAVLKKIMSDKSLLLKYDSLLNSFNDLYRTDIPKELVTLFIKNQIDTMSGWEIINQEVTGSGSSQQTYSMPGRNLYVMVPDQISVQTAKDKINSVLSVE